jgi:hypothetical protein
VFSLANIPRLPEEIQLDNSTRRVTWQGIALANGSYTLWWDLNQVGLLSDLGDYVPTG